MVEWKESARGDGIQKAVCAFANDLHDRRRPGVVFVGADDAGKPTGLTIDESLLNALSGMRSDGNILPPPSLRVAPLAVGGVQVVSVQVMPSVSPPVQFKGRIYVRDGASNRVAVAEDERVLAEKRRFHDAPFELHPIPCRRHAAGSGFGYTLRASICLQAGAAGHSGGKRPLVGAAPGRRQDDCGGG